MKPAPCSSPESRLSKKTCRICTEESGFFVAVTVTWLPPIYGHSMVYACVCICVCVCVLEFVQFGLGAGEPWRLQHRVYACELGARDASGVERLVSVGRRSI